MAAAKKPLHLQAEEYIRKLIQEKKYKEGKLLPKEVDLAQQLHISRNTLRLAINKLVMEGLLVRKKGIGTKVARQSVVSGLQNWLSFSQEMKRMGLEICNFELHVSYRTFDNEIREFFNLKGDSAPKTLVMERVRGTEDNPFVYFISYFNPELGIRSDEDFTRPLYEMLDKEYDIHVKTSIEEISARLAGRDIAEKLDISENDPILIRKRFIYDDNKIPVEYNIGYYKAECFTYKIQADRN